MLIKHRGFHSSVRTKVKILTENPELRYINTSKNEKGKWAWKGKLACFIKVKKVSLHGLILKKKVGEHVILKNKKVSLRELILKKKVSLPCACCQCKIIKLISILIYVEKINMWKRSI